MRDFKSFEKIVILTGAGISAESGISTFRDSNGLWEQYKIEDVATPEAFLKKPLLVWKFYSLRRAQAAKAHPNQAHLKLVELASQLEGRVHLITQNVDVLHHRADPNSLLEPICMHGSLHQSRCSSCESIYFDDHSYLDEKGSAFFSTALCDGGQKVSTEYLHQYQLKFKDSLPLSPCCQKLLRPHIVWFGEIPHFMPKIEALLSTCDLFISIGTSGQVYPAAGFLQAAKLAGATTICINKEEIPQSRWIDHFIQGAATEVLAKYI